MTIRRNYSIRKGNEWNGLGVSTPISGYVEIRGVERIQEMEDDQLSNHEVSDCDVPMEG